LISGIREETVAAHRNVYQGALRQFQTTVLVRK
jgi:hypothetical protein